MELCLASKSPQRNEILENLGFSFRIITPAEIDEDNFLNNSSLSPVEKAVEIAKNKSLALEMEPGEVVLTADTIVAVGNKAFGKPRDNTEAVEFLRLLSGKTHQVITAIALKEAGNKPALDYESTDVHFIEMSDADIDWYVASKEPFGKAGGYAIQGKGGIFIDRIVGCYFNVVGLPVYKLIKLLTDYGYDYRMFFTSKGNQ